MESNLSVFKQFTLQAQSQEHHKRGGELGDVMAEMIMAGRRQRDDMEEETLSNCYAPMMPLVPAPIPALPLSATAALAIPLIGPVVGNGVNKKKETIGQMTRMLCVDTIHGDYFQFQYRLQSTTITNTADITNITAELNSTTIKSFEDEQHNHHHHHHHLSVSSSSTASSVISSGSFFSDDADALSSVPTTPVIDKVPHNFPIAKGSNNDKDETEVVGSNEQLNLPIAVSSVTTVTPADAVLVTVSPPKPTAEEVSDDGLDKEMVQVWSDHKGYDTGDLGDDDASEESDEEDKTKLLGSNKKVDLPVTAEPVVPNLAPTKISAPRPSVEEVTDDELAKPSSLQVWHNQKADDTGDLGDDDDSQESDEDDLEEETDSGEEEDSDGDESDDEAEAWGTDDEEEGRNTGMLTPKVTKVKMAGFVFGYSDDEDEEDSGSEDAESDGEEEEEDDEDFADCANDGLFGYDSADDSDDEDASGEEEEDEEDEYDEEDNEIPVTLIEESLACPMRRIDSHRKFDRPPLRSCISSVSMKREESNSSSTSGSRVRFSETAERPQIIKTTHFRYSYYEFEAHLKSSECSSELKSTFGDSRTEMEKFQEINFLRESYITLLDDDDAARERNNPSNSLVGKVEHILLSKAMESRGEDCTLEDIGFGSTASFCTEALFALIGGKIKLSDFDKKEHAKGDQAPPCTPIATPDASGDEWETECDEDENEN